MMRLLSSNIFITLFYLLSNSCSAAFIFINEIHYDNAGTDQNEFIEVTGKAGIDLSDWSLVLYNGSNGEVYDTITLSGRLTDQSNGFGFAAFFNTGIQNGIKDGIALVYQNVVEQFISYEGTLMGSNGVAAGLISEDIGISESSATPLGYSLQLTGTGLQYSDFTWQSLGASAGQINSQQQINNQQSIPEPNSSILLLSVLVLLSLSKKHC